MSQPAALPSAAIEAAKAKQKQLEDLAFARGVKQGRADERRDILANAGQRTLDDLSMLGALQRSHEEQLAKLSAHHEALMAQSEREERKHGRHQLWRGATIGALAGALLAGAATFVVIDAGQKAAFDAATEATARGVIVDRASKAAEQ